MNNCLNVCQKYNDNYSLPTFFDGIKIDKNIFKDGNYYYIKEDSSFKCYILLLPSDVKNFMIIKGCFSYEKRKGYFTKLLHYLIRNVKSKIFLDIDNNIDLITVFNNHLKKGTFNLELYNTVLDEIVNFSSASVMNKIKERVITGKPNPETIYNYPDWIWVVGSSNSSSVLRTLKGRYESSEMPIIMQFYNYFYRKHDRNTGEFLPNRGRPTDQHPMVYDI